MYFSITLCLIFSVTESFGKQSIQRKVDDRVAVKRFLFLFCV